MTVDVTAPVAGWVHDGPDEREDMMYSSLPASLHTYWGGYRDPESSIHKYTATVTVNQEEVKVMQKDGTVTKLEDHSLHFQQRDEVKVQVEATNGAGRYDYMVGWLIQKQSMTVIHCQL